MKYTIALTFCVTVFTISILRGSAEKEKGSKLSGEEWCSTKVPHFGSNETNCPIERGDYLGCCLCTHLYYFECLCCKPIIEEIGLLANCSEWGTPKDESELIC